MASVTVTQCALRPVGKPCPGVSGAPVVCQHSVPPLGDMLISPLVSDGPVIRRINRGKQIAGDSLHQIRPRPRTVDIGYRNGKVHCRRSKSRNGIVVVGPAIRGIKGRLKYPACEWRWAVSPPQASTSTSTKTTTTSKVITSGSGAIICHP